jgi:ABC-2 type transport system ATP-binding protein
MAASATGPPADGAPPPDGAPPADVGATPDGAPPVLIEGLTKRLGRGVPALDGLDLSVHTGQIVGLAGPNGAGKSVTMKILLGLVRPSSGRVELFGEPARPGAKALARVGALVDGPGFVPHLSGIENLRLSGRMAGAAVSDGDIEAAVEIAGLGEALERPFTTYSHGMRYRLGLAQALLGEPALLLLDEPTTGLDPAHVLEIREAIAAAAARGATVLFSSHQLSEIERVCTHAAVMRGGRLIAFGSVAELRGAHASLDEAYLDLIDGERPPKNAPLSTNAHPPTNVAPPPTHGSQPGGSIPSPTESAP